MHAFYLRLLPSLGIGLFFSLFINVLTLGYIFYLRLLFDKIMPNRSVETLVYLTLLVILAYVVSGVLEALRARLLTRVGVRFEQLTEREVFGRLLHGSVNAGAARHTQGLSDIGSIRNFLGGAGIMALFDAPWVPVYLGVVFLFHPLLGLVACAGAGLLGLMVLAQELTTRNLARRYVTASRETGRFIGAALRNAQSVNSMGMLPALSRRWRQYNQREMTLELAMSARNLLFHDLAKALMMGIILGVMATGSYLSIANQITLGTMIAASMFMGKGIQPLMMLGMGWKQLQEARQASQRLQALLSEPSTGERQAAQALAATPPPRGLFTTALTLDLADKPVLRCPALHLQPGQLLIVKGANGCGKSTLARVLLGLWHPDAGAIWLHGERLEQFAGDALGRRCGYLAQDVELFAATVAENIARLGPVDSPAVVAAAQTAQVHDMILQLPQGYDTPVGDRTKGVQLSGGQKQRIALARALYREPELIVLDEPDSHLDHGSRGALVETFNALRARGAMLVVISHNADLIGVADGVLDLDRGVMEAVQPEPAGEAAPALAASSA